MKEIPLENQPLPRGHFEKEFNFDRLRTPREWVSAINNLIGKRVIKINLFGEDKGEGNVPISFDNFEKLYGHSITFLGVDKNSVKLVDNAIRLIRKMRKKES